MGLRAKVSQRQRRLGEELRKLREQAAVPRTEVCRQVGIQAPHLSNIEAGRTACPEPRLRALAEAYGCTNKPMVEALVEMANASGKGWWSKYAKTMEQRVLDLAEVESMATAHRSFEWLYVPGLLQTPAYMRALFRRAHPDASPEAIDSYVTFRLQRQQVLTAPGAVRYHAVIHETAFHMNFADRETRREQLDYLLQLSRFAHITIQLLPFSAEAHPVTPGAPFTILDSHVPELSTVYVEHPVTSVYLGERERIERFAADFARLSSVSLAPIDPEAPLGEGSLGLVQHLAYALKEGPS